MRKLFTPLSFIALLLLLVSGNCKKEKQPEPDNPYGLPNATQTGENIFACRVNGQKWISDKGVFHNRGGVTNDTLATSADRNENGFELIVLIVKGNAAQGASYGFSDTTKALAEFRTNNLCGIQTGSVYRYYSLTGSINIAKLDLPNKIISGTFNFNAARIDCNDTLKITDGRFDMRY
ncbi:MAG TPA: DUF6252 family protein [Chitinophagaceae bacterium]